MSDLEGMGEFDEDETELSGLEIWLRKDASVSNFILFGFVVFAPGLTLVVVAFC